MKKQNKNIAKLIVALAVFSGGAAAQNVAWYGQFTVTIRGKGHREAPSVGTATLDWNIDRSYSGSFTMVVPRKKSDSVRGPAEPGRDVFVADVGPTKPSEITVSINDRVVQTYRSPGEIMTSENKTVTTTWNGLGPESGDSRGAELIINKAGRSYFVFIPLIPKIKTKNVKMKRQTEIHRSRFGYGDKPTHEVQPALEDVVGANEFAPPNTNGILHSRSALYLAPFESDSPLPASYPGLIEVKNKCLPSGKINLAGLPENLAEAEICYSFTFSKTPIR